MPGDLLQEIDADQFSQLKPKLFRKMDVEAIGSIDPGAFEGLTPKQGSKVNKVVASGFDPAQIRSIQPECLAALPGPVFKILEPDLSKKQLNGLEALQGEGGGDIGGPVI